MLHAHIGSGPQWQELHDNLHRLADEFAVLLRQMPALEAVSLGGGIPFQLSRARPRRCRSSRCANSSPLAARSSRGRRPARIRVEIEPGRYYVAPACTLVTRVSDLKTTAHE